MINWLTADQSPLPAASSPWVGSAGRVTSGLYVFLMGFVWIEPAPAEWLVVLTLPLFVLVAWPLRRLIIVSGILFTISRAIPVVVLLATGTEVAWRFLLIDIYLFVVLLWVLAVVLREEDHARYLEVMMYFWIGGALVNVTIGIAAYLFQFETLFGSVRLMRTGLRFEGFFKDPNVFGSYLIPPLAWLFHRVTTGRSRKMVLLHLFAFLLLSFGLIMSFSRGAWLGAVVSLGLFALVGLFRGGRIQRVRIILLIAAGLLVLVALLVFDPQMINPSWTFREIFLRRTGLQEYDQKRFGAWAEALRFFMRRPFFGIGAGQFDRAYFMSVHNSFLRFVVELGVFGVITHVAIVLLWFQKTSRLGGVNRVLLISLIGLLASAIFVDALHWRHLVVTMALCIALRPAPLSNGVTTD